LKARVEGSAHEEMMMLANMKGNDAMMRSLYADLKAPGFDFDGIDSDSSIELEADPTSFEMPHSGPPSVTDGNEDTFPHSDESESEAKSPKAEPVNPTAYRHYFDMYQAKPKEKEAVASSCYAPPGGYRTKREKQIAKLAGSMVQQKLLKALHLIELLQKANNKLTESMEDLEDTAALAQRMERYLLLVVTFMSLLVCGLGFGLITNCRG